MRSILAVTHLLPIMKMLICGILNGIKKIFIFTVSDGAAALYPCSIAVLNLIKFLFLAERVNYYSVVTNKDI